MRPVPRRIATLAAGATALLACQGAGASPAGRPDCGPAHARTLARDREVRVYTTAGGAPWASAYACLSGRGRGAPLALAASGRGAPVSVDRVALAGTVVAYVRDTHGVDAGRADIVVVDVAGGRTLRTIAGAGGFTDACIIRFREVTDLVVTPWGTVAWIVREGARCRTTSLAVYRAVVSGGPVPLERGPGIIAGSLRRAHGVVRWRDARGWRSARLPSA